VNRVRAKLLLWVISINLILVPSVWGFEYGQCLFDRSDTFNTELKNYKNVAMAKAAIKGLLLNGNKALLKWNYETTRVIYDLIVLQPLLLQLDSVYQTVQARNSGGLPKIQEYLTGELAHSALLHIDAEKDSEETDGFDEFLEFLGDQMPNDGDLQDKVQTLGDLVAKDQVKDALGDLYDRIQEASVGATPIEPDSIKQWIQLAESFKSDLALPGCPDCQVAFSQYANLVDSWAMGATFPEEDSFEKQIQSQIPPLLKIQYPKLAVKDNKDNDAARLLRYYYTRTIEDFLFSRSGFTEADVVAWMKTDPRYKAILQQANKDSVSYAEPNITTRVYKYLITQDRVLNNTFDHFVWQGQSGTVEEKSIDGIARTLFGEAQSCQNDGAKQFEAIASIIAARAISVDQENQENNLFSNIVDYAFSAVQLLSPVEIAPLQKYTQGSSDFGRSREIQKNPMISQMPTPVRVVSHPVQFSVWKVSGTQELPVTLWIPWPTNGGYPADLTVSVAGVSKSELDSPQRKVLCPNYNADRRTEEENPLFKEAVVVAKELMNDYYAFANRYRFYQGNTRLIPYFYTHGPKTNLSFAKRLLPNPTFVRLNSDASMVGGVNMEELPIFTGDVNCKTLKLYRPIHFEKNAGNKKANPKNKRSRRR
jgi:hypothetical protein